MLKVYFLEKYNKLKSQLKKKFSERLTIMIIPHGNEKIYNIHISFLVLVFLSFLFLLLAIQGITSYIHYQEIAGKIEELENLYGKNYRNIFNIQKSLNELHNYHESHVMKHYSRFLEKSLTGKISTLFPLEEIPERAIKRLDNEILARKELVAGTKYVKATYMAAAIKDVVSYQTEILKEVEKLYTQKTKIVFSIPHGRPVVRYTDTSGYGIRLDPFTRSSLEFHSGIDMSGSYNEPVFATADGIVEKVTYDAGYGLSVLIRHYSGYYTLYAHLARTYVNSNQRVSKGQLIGGMGSTGRSTGIHLHYEVQLPNQDRVNPVSFICLTDMTSYKCKVFRQRFQENI